MVERAKKVIERMYAPIYRGLHSHNKRLAEGAVRIFMRNDHTNLYA